MNPSPEGLIADPIFQLNALLWLAQPLPEDSDAERLGVAPLDIKPLLYRQGFGVYAIAPLLPTPIDLRLAARNAGLDVQDSVRPDVILQRPRDDRFLLVECKATSFGPDSTSAEQARALLLLSGPRLAEVLPDRVQAALLAYALPEGHREKLTGTLDNLSGQMAAVDLPAGPFSVLGLLAGESSLDLVLDERAGALLGLAAGGHVFIKQEPDQDLRPLYFIPYDPDVTQSEEEGRFCKGTLLRRMHCTVVAAVGRALPPTELVFDAPGVLNDAMFGMYEHWENSASAKHMRKLFNHFMGSIAGAVGAECPGAVAFESGVGWRLTIGDESLQDTLLDLLTRFNTDSLSVTKKPEPDLFDD